MKLNQKNGELQKEGIKLQAGESQRSLVTIRIVSPYKLSSEEIDLSLKHLPFIFPKNMEIVNSVDKSLIAGIVIMYRSKMIDLSLKNRLENLRKDLYEGL